MFRELIPIFEGQPVYIVGGAVRDRLLGRATSDFDLVAPMNPVVAANKIADALGGSAFHLDKERGIMRIALGNHVHVDLAKQQGKTLNDDLGRRDFSINALAVPLVDWIKPSWRKHIIDRHQGVKDLERKWITPVSASVFTEDPLRILRAFRIAAELDFLLPTPTLKSISKHKNLIRKPSPERIREELLRIFSTPRTYAILVKMEHSGVLDVIFPEAKALRKTAPAHYGKGGVLKHTLESVKCFEEILEDRTWFKGLTSKIRAHLNELVSGYPRLAHCKWGLMLHDIGKPETMKMMDGRLRFFEHEHIGANKVPTIAKRFRWSSDETSRYEKLVRHHMRAGNLASQDHVSDKAIHRYFRDLEDDAVSMLLVSLGDHLTYLTKAQKRKRNSPHERITIKMIRRYYNQREKIIPPKLLTGYDVMKEFNLKPSPLIGALLSDLQEAQTERSIQNKSEALSYLKSRVAVHQRTFGVVEN